MKIVTWNVNSINVRALHLVELIKKHNPDIICLQELKCEESKFPYKYLDGLGYNIYILGEKTYNGVAILSKKPADNIKTNFPDDPSQQARFIEITINSEVGYSRIISLYAPNGSDLNSEKFTIKLKFYDAFLKYLNSIKSPDEKIFICGDYNVAPFDIDLYDPIVLKESLCTSLKERKKFRSLLNNGFADNFRIKNPEKEEFSWWDYRGNGFRRNEGMRIDMILSSYNAIDNLIDCFIDKEMRAMTRPSDHAPVISIYS